MLSSVADRLGRSSLIRQIDRDDGWWESRDLTIVDRGGVGLDLQALVENHGNGRCLWRLRIRARATAAVPTLCGFAAINLLWSGAPAAWAIGLLVASAVAFTDLVATSVVVATTCDDVAASAGMVPFERSPLCADRPRSWGAVAFGARAGERAAR